MDDPFFGPAFVDVDEWRDTPVRHRHVHGGFDGTDTRFSFYFPPAEQWEGRLLQTLEGGNGGHENTAASPFGHGAGGGIGFALASGCYLVESNQGHFGDDMRILLREPTVGAYRASAQSARYSWVIAEEMYGSAPHHGYVFGGSGGSARCLLCLENCPDVWQGAVPFIMGHSTSWSLGFSVQAHAARVLGTKMADVIDAVEPGGSGTPFDDLSTEQREALAAMYRAGFPRGAEASFGTSGYAGTFASHISALEKHDPTYIDDFWSVPGYMGADGQLATSLIEEKTTVTRVVTAADLAATGDPRGRMLLMFSGSVPERQAGGGAGDARAGVVLDGMEPSVMVGAAMQFVTGNAAGRKLFCTGAVGDMLLGGAGTGERFEGVAPGDEVLVDNREYLAYTYFHRHQVDANAPEYAQFRVDGRPLYPQREKNFARSGLLSGGTPRGTFTGKMIVVQNAHDAACWPNAAISYRRAVERNVGAALSDHYRLWFNEHAAHLPASFNPVGEPPVPTTRLIDYGGSLEQALRDLMEWVEDGTPPPAETGYILDTDQRLTLAPSAAERGGVQPVVRASANGAVGANVAVGEPVTLAVVADAPPGGGTIIRAEWDFDGTGAFGFVHDEVDGSRASLQLATTHAFDAPGTYFPSVRVTAHRDGNVDAPHCRLVNLGRVRVVVR
ncbi:MAG: hypothetical protein WD271_14180 [Acidimicrobiia bacterium]